MISYQAGFSSFLLFLLVPPCNDYRVDPLNIFVLNLKQNTVAICKHHIISVEGWHYFVATRILVVVDFLLCLLGIFTCGCLFS